jgi:hypothetical protein
MVLNLTTGSITAQFHVEFYDLFSTVSSVDREHEPPDHWEDLCLESATQIRVEDPPEYISDEWLTREELDQKRLELYRQEIRMNSNRAAQVDRRNHVPLQRQQTAQPTDDRSAGTPRATNVPLLSIVKTEDTPTTEGVRHDPSPEGTTVSEGVPCVNTSGKAGA